MDQWIPLDEALTDIKAFAQLAFTAYESRPGSANESVMFPKLPADIYHADRDALSCSMLKPLLTSPAHFQASLVASTCKMSTTLSGRQRLQQGHQHTGREVLVHVVGQAIEHL